MREHIQTHTHTEAECVCVCADEWDENDANHHDLLQVRSGPGTKLTESRSVKTEGCPLQWVCVYVCVCVCACVRVCVCEGRGSMGGLLSSRADTMTTLW